MHLYGVENKHKTVIMKLDRYKQAVLETYLNTTSNIFVNATAGSGKTTMLLRLLEATPSYKESLFLAFNKSIVNELESRVMGRGEVKTIHSKAYSTLLRNKKCRFKLSKWRDYSICKKYLNFSEKLDDKGVNARIMNISRIWNLIRVNLLSINDMEGIQQACLRWDIDFDLSYYEDMKKFVEKIEEETNGLKVQSLDIDFTDQLYLTWKYIPETLYQKYDVIFCDEAQDLNPLQRELILRMLKPNGRLVVCGDYSQAIYGFQGSSVDSFKAFENMPNTVSLPLSISYRCPRKVVEYARQYSENIEACDDAIDGVVRPGTIEEVRAGDYVLCRNNLPLVESFIKLLKNGKKSLILGKDYGDGLLRILLRVETVRDLINLLYEKREELKEKGVNNFSANEAYVSLLEKVEILKILFAEAGSMMKVRGMVEDIFSDDENKENIILSTIHKSKGLEADKVFLLGFHELIPSKYATTELALYGEKCLQFVAVTRAKKELIFIPYKSKENVKEETETVY